MAYGMLIDLKKCVGCHACATACKGAHGTPPGVTRSHVERSFEGTYPDARKTILPVLCNHCENAPCVEACPSGATMKREDGIVVIDKEVCIGCKACVSACPYGARYYYESETGYFGELNEYEQVKYAEDMPTGKVDKCTFCADRIDAGKGEVQACVAACPAGARVFGDLEEIKKKALDEGGFQLAPENGTNPSVWYIPNNVVEAGEAKSQN